MCLVGLKYIGLVSGRSESPVGVAVVGLVSGRSRVCRSSVW